MYQKVLGILLLSLLSQACASTANNVDPYQSSTKADRRKEISRKEWLARLQKLSVTHMCQPAQYFRACFEVSEGRCQSTVKGNLNVCFNENRNSIPEPINLGNETQQWAGTLLECAGRRYEEKLGNRRISNDSCNDPVRWMTR